MKITDLLVQPIMEGVIKLPPKLLAKAKQEFHTLVYSYGRASCLEIAERMVKAEDATSAGVKFAMKAFDDYFSKKHPGLAFKSFDTKQKTVTRTIGDFEDDDLEPRYRKALEKSKLNMSYEWNRDARKPLRMIMVLKPLGASGMYSSRPNTIEISFDWFKHFGWDEFIEYAQLAFDENDDIERRKMIRILERYSDRADKMEGTLEHEMTHYIQFKVFGGASDAQIGEHGKALDTDDKATRNASAYYSSQVEFDPQIKSHAKDLIVTIRANKRMKGMEALSWKDAALVAVGEKKAAEVIAKNELPKWTILGNEQQFFKSLKRVDKDKWKKAVKLFMQLVGDAFEGKE
jgi:hypothetical protein